jgi:hypothetical protein
VIEAQRRIHELESQREQEPQHTEPPVAEPRQVEQPQPEPRRPEPRHEEPRIDAKKDLEDAGLVMIETDRARAPSQPVVEPEQVQLGRPRRERARPAAQDEDLQQVETGKK